MADKQSDENAIFRATIDDDTGRFFSRFNSRLDDAAKKGYNAFGRVEGGLNRVKGAAGEAAGSGRTGIAGIGFAAGIAGGAVVALAQQAVSALNKLKEAALSTISESIDLASTQQSAKITFTNILGGDAEAAEAFLTRINEKAIELGTNSDLLAKFSKSLLPDTKSVAEFEKLVQAAVTLEKSDPDKTLDDVRFAFEEALSGNFRSLQQRFDLPKAVIENIRKAQAEGVPAVTALVDALDKEFARTGQNLESFQGTFGNTFGRLQGQVTQLKTKFGEPILEPLTEQFAILEKFVIDNKDTLTLFAQSMGDVIGLVVELVGSGLNDFLQDLDPSFLLKVADALYDGVLIGKEFATVAIQIAGSVGKFIGALSPTTQAVQAFTEKSAEAKNESASLKEIIFGVIDFLYKTKAGWEGINAAITPTTSVIRDIARSFVELASGNPAGAVTALDSALRTASQGLLDMKAAETAADESYKQSRQSLEELKQALEVNNQKLAERTEELGRSKDAELERVDAVLAAKNAEKELEKQQEKSKAAAEDLARLKVQVARQLEDQEISRIRREIDKEIEASRRREDIARQTARTLSRIAKDEEKAIAEAKADAAKQREQIEEDAQKAEQQLIEDSADAKVEIERQHQLTLQQIRENFLRDAREAQIRNDAIAFLQAKRRQQDERKDAEKQRKLSLDDVTRNFEDQTKALREQLDEQRKALEEDLKTRLEEIKKSAEEQRQAFFEQLALQEEDYQLSLKRREEDEKRALERQREDFVRNLERQLEDLKEKHGDQINVTAEGLIAQAEEYKKVYGPDGQVTQTMLDFYTEQELKLRGLTEQAVEAANAMNEALATEGVGSLGHTSSNASDRGGARGARGRRGRGQPTGQHLPAKPKPNQIGQGGLVSQFLANSGKVRFDSVPIRTSTTTNNTNMANLAFDFRGLLPEMQRIAVLAAVDVYRNVAHQQGEVRSQ